jgi:hypothetical protein
LKGILKKAREFTQGEGGLQKSGPAGGGAVAAMSDGKAI